MSRVGKKPVSVPQGVTVQLKDGNIEVKGPKGVLSWRHPEQIEVRLEDGTVVCEMKDRGAKALYGLTRAYIQNMVTGVTDGYVKEMKIVGTGYKVSVSGKTVVLNVGYSHPVELEIPEGISVEVTSKKGDEFKISGIDKQKVGQFAATIRRVRPPEPYKGKGIRYKDEYVRTKTSKKVGA